MTTSRVFVLAVVLTALMLSSSSPASSGPGDITQELERARIVFVLDEQFASLRQTDENTKRELLRQKLPFKKIKGKWLSDTPNTELLIITPPVFAGIPSMFHELLVVIDSSTGRFLTPVYWYSSSKGQLVILRGHRQDAVFCFGAEYGQCDFFRSRYYLVKFRVGDVDVAPVLGEADPELRMILGQGKKFILYQVGRFEPPPERVIMGPCDERRVRQMGELQWNPEAMRFDINWFDDAQDRPWTKEGPTF